MQRTTRTRHYLAFAAFVLAISAPSLFGQTSSSTISGTVTDASGATVVGASVAVKNLDTGVTENLTSNSAGLYRAPEVVIGNYEVRVTHPGFETVVRAGIQTSVGEESIVDIVLPVGQASQVVTVDSVVSQVDTSTTALSVTFDQQQIADLPMGTARNFVDLINLAPGVASIQGGGNVYGQQANYTVSGSRPTGLGFLIDSTNLTTFNGKSAGSGATGFSPGIEALSQFQVLTNTYTAQFGGNGIVVNAASKSGTNTFHGSAYTFLSNSALNARGEFDSVVLPGQTVAKVPPSRTIVAGGTIGGPIKKNKLFFFLNYEATRQAVSSTSINQNVPDANAKLGYLPCKIAGTSFGCNAATGLAYVGFAQGIQPIMNLLPTAQVLSLSNGLPTGLGVETQLNPQVNHDNYTLGRLDYTLSDRDTIFLRVIGEQAYRLQTDAVGVFTEKDATSNWYATLEERHTISPSMINLARVSFLRPQETGTQNTPSFPPLQLIPGSTLDAQFSIVNTTLGPAKTVPFNLTQDGYQGMDDVIWTRGAHSVKFGAAMTYTQDFAEEVNAPGGAITFSTMLTFLQGLPGKLNAPVPGQNYANRDMTERLVTPYIHDEWKVSRRLTLNIGMRYEWAANPSERRNNFWNFPSPTTNKTWVQIPTAFANNPTNKNFAPRFGFAFDPFSDHKTSIRGGFGIFYDVMTGHIILPSYFGSFPFTSVNVNTAPWPNPYQIFLNPVTPPTPTLTAGLLYGNGKTSTPYAMQFNMNVQRDIYKGTIMTVAYVGSRGVHLLQTVDMNPALLINGVFGTLASNGNTTPNPRVNASLSGLGMRQTTGNSDYNALQVSVTRRFANHFSSQISYAYSRSLDYGSSFSQDTAIGNNVQIEDPYNTKLDRGRSTFDRTQVFRTNTVYELPFTKNQFVKGWKLTGVWTMNTGAPTTVYTGFDRSGLSGNSGGVNRPNFVAGCSVYPAQPNIAEWFNPGCYSLQAVGTLGNLGRTTVVGPAYRNMALGLLKDTRISKVSELFDVQFRAEIANLFNHPNLNLNGNGASNATQIFLNGGTATTPAALNPIAGQISNQVGSGRSITLALKVIF